MSARVEIRDAVASDWEAIAALHAASWSASYRGIMRDDFLDGPVEDDRRAFWDARLAGRPVDPDRITVVADGAGRGLAGICCILAGHHGAHGSLVDNLHVRPGGTRNRLGRDLLRAGAARLAAGPHGSAPVHIFVFDANARAVGAYEGWGGRLDERALSDGPHRGPAFVRRYGWDSPAALLAGLDAARS